MKGRGKAGKIARARQGHRHGKGKKGKAGDVEDVAAALRNLGIAEGTELWNRAIASDRFREQLVLRGGDGGSS